MEYSKPQLQSTRLRDLVGSCIWYWHYSFFGPFSYPQNMGAMSVLRSLTGCLLPVTPLLRDGRLLRPHKRRPSARLCRACDFRCAEQSAPRCVFTRTSHRLHTAPPQASNSLRLSAGCFLHRAITHAHRRKQPWPWPPPNPPCPQRRRASRAGCGWQPPRCPQPASWR